MTKIKEYYYNVDLQRAYINIYTNQNNKRDRVYSIELNSLRIDVWTMTGGGYTTREMFPVGLCEFVEIDNFLSYIETLNDLYSIVPKGIYESVKWARDTIISPFKIMLDELSILCLSMSAALHERNSLSREFRVFIQAFEDLIAITAKYITLGHSQHSYFAIFALFVLGACKLEYGPINTQKEPTLPRWGGSTDFEFGPRYHPYGSQMERTHIAHMGPR